jgi:hypothetical protein
MPIYEYSGPDGCLIERCLPVDQRDRYPGRVTIPRRVHVGRGLLEPSTVGAAVPRALRELEIKHGGHGDRLAREMGFSSRREIQRIWEPEVKASH